MRDSGLAISDEGFDGFHSNGDAHDEPLDGSVSTAASGSVVEEAALLGCAARQAWSWEFACATPSRSSRFLSAARCR